VPILVLIPTPTKSHSLVGSQLRYEACQRGNAASPPCTCYNQSYPRVANLIALLNEYGDAIEGFRERVSGDYARGHKEATGGIIPKVRPASRLRLMLIRWKAEFGLLLEQMGVASATSPRKQTPTKPSIRTKVIDPKQTNGIMDFFKAREPQKEVVTETKHHHA